MIRTIGRHWRFWVTPLVLVVIVAVVWAIVAASVVYDHDLRTIVGLLIGMVTGVIGGNLGALWDGWEDR